MRRLPRSPLDLLLPNTGRKVKVAQERQKAAHDSHAKPRSFQVGDLVFVKNFSGSHPNPLWIPGQVSQVKGPLSYQVELQGGRSTKKHIDHLRKRTIDNLDAADNSYDSLQFPSSQEEEPPEPGLRRSQRARRARRPPDRYSPT